MKYVKKRLLITEGDKKIAEVVTKSTRKKFPQSWVFNILKRESTIPPNDSVIIYNLKNTLLNEDNSQF